MCSCNRSAILRYSRGIAVFPTLATWGKSFGPRAFANSKFVFTIFKVAAIFDAVTSRRGDHVKGGHGHAYEHILWMDADATMVRQPDERFFAWHSSYDAATHFFPATPGTRAHAWGWKFFAETGIIYISHSEAAQAVVHAARAAYTLPGLIEAQHGVNDIYVFGQLLAPGLNATSSRSLLRTGNYMDPSAIGFRIGDYVQHHKGNGPMVRLGSGDARIRQPAGRKGGASNISV